MSEHPFYSEAIVKQLKSRIATLEQQLVAQRAIVAADDALHRSLWPEVNCAAVPLGSVWASSFAARVEAKRIDEVT
jgi:hypothetical protein